MSETERERNAWKDRWIVLVTVMGEAVLDNAEKTYTAQEIMNRLAEIERVHPAHAPTSDESAGVREVITDFQAEEYRRELYGSGDEPTDRKRALALLDEWLADKSGYDEEAWREIKATYTEDNRRYCQTCGTEVEVVSGDEGTSYYRPVRDRLDGGEVVAWNVLRRDAEVMTTQYESLGMWKSKDQAEAECRKLKKRGMDAEIVALVRRHPTDTDTEESDG